MLKHQAIVVPMCPGSRVFAQLKSVYPKIVEIIPVTKAATPKTLCVNFDKSGFNFKYFFSGCGNIAVSPASNVGASKNKEAMPEIIF